MPPAEPGDSQRLLNLRAAIRNVNPLLLGNPISSMVTGQQPHREGSWGETINNAMGPFGLRQAGGFVHDVNQWFDDLQGPRAQTFRYGRRFENEGEYQVLCYSHQQITEIDHAIQGLHRQGGRLVTGSALPEERVQL